MPADSLQGEANAVFRPSMPGELFEIALHAINAGVLTKTVTSFVVLGLLLGAQNPGVAQTQTELTAQACGEFKKADTELYKVYQQILAANAGNAAFVKALREAQRA